MIIETWILVMVLIFLGGGSIIALLGWMATSARNEELHRQLDFEKGNVRELKMQLVQSRVKNNVKVANDFYESGNK